MVDENRCLRMCMAGGCILCILTPFFSIIPICVLALRDGNRIECAGPGVGIPVVYIIIVALNQKCIFSAFRWLKNLVFPHSPENQDDKHVAGQTQTDPRKSFIKALRLYNTKGRNEDETCSICLQGRSRLKKFSELPCKHVFHRKCITRWIEKQVDPSCPLCRNKGLDQASEQSQKGRESSEVVLHL